MRYQPINVVIDRGVGAGRDQNAKIKWVDGNRDLSETNRLAQAICGSDAGPARREQAQIIAECELLLLLVRAARVKIFEEISWRAPVQRSDEPSVLSHQQDATSCLQRLMRLERYRRS